MEEWGKRQNKSDSIGHMMETRLVKASKKFDNRPRSGLEGNVGKP